MLAIARAIVLRPRILLVDELSFGLAPTMVAAAFRVVKEMNAQDGTTVVLVEQNVGKALEIATWGYVLRTGSVVLEASAEELVKNREALFGLMGAQIH
jgi:branched-chain amino acid transport system ATP-binding protein